MIGDEHVVNQAGELRTFDVKIGGTDWVSPLPTGESVSERIGEVMAIKNPVERGLRLFGAVSRGRQWFPDGNKRTAQLAANASLIKDGCGILAVPTNEMLGFRELLIEFYETGEFDKLGSFLYDKALDGSRFSEAQRPNSRDSHPY